MTGATRLPPPAGYDGSFTTTDQVRRSYARASGPFRIEPAAVAAPDSPEALRELILWASAESVPLIPRGAGTGMPGGNVGAGVALDLVGGFDDIGPVDGEGRFVRVGTGALAGAVDRAAREAGLFLPALPSSADRCTIGGMASNNAAGSRSFKYGSVREWVHSLDVILADGRYLTLERAPVDDGYGEGRDLLDAGGPRGDDPGGDPLFASLKERLQSAWPRIERGWPRVRKNSSGYALDRFLGEGDPVDLFVGSEGTLGVITGATLRLQPLPEAVAVGFLAVRDASELMAVASRAEELGASACEFFGRRFIELAGLEDDPRVGAAARAAYALVMLELDGGKEEVRDAVEGVRELATSFASPALIADDPTDRDDFWAVRHASSPMIDEAAEAGRISMQFIEDSVVPPARMPEYLAGLDRILLRHGTDAVVFGHAGDANVHVNPLVDVTRQDWRARVRAIMDETVDLVSSLGGTLTGEHGDGRVRAPYLDHIYSAEAVDAFRTVKESLDPATVLNPGVILPLEGQDPLEGMTAER